MNGIIINDKNADRITKAIAEAEGRATARTLTFEQLTNALERFERRLGIAKKDMVGIEIDIDYHAQNFPHAYRFHAESTQVTVVRTASGWKLTSVGRYFTRTEGHEFKAKLTDLAKQSIIASMEDF